MEIQYSTQQYHFQFLGVFYEQIYGVAMVSPLAHQMLNNLNNTLLND